MDLSLNFIEPLSPLSLASRQSASIRRRSLLHSPSLGASSSPSPVRAAAALSSARPRSAHPPPQAHRSAARMDVCCDLCGRNFSDVVQNFRAHLRDRKPGYILIAIAIVFFLFFGCVVALIVSSNPFLYLLLQQARAGSGCKWMS